MNEEQLKMIDDLRYFDSVPEDYVEMLEEILEFNGYEFEPIEEDECCEQL